MKNKKKMTSLVLEKKQTVLLKSESYFDMKRNNTSKIKKTFKKQCFMFCDKNNYHFDMRRK